MIHCANRQLLNKHTILHHTAKFRLSIHTTHPYVSFPHGHNIIALEKGEYVGMVKESNAGNS